MAIKAGLTDFGQAREDANILARQIANHVVSGADVPADLVDEYTRAVGRIDAAIDEVIGADWPGESL